MYSSLSCEQKQNKVALSFREEINPLKWWNSSNIWEQLKQMKSTFRKKLRAD
jgi:hypothetical protein